MPGGRRRRRGLQIDLCAEKLFGIKATFGESNSEPALGAIMCAFYETGANQIANSILHLDFKFEIDVRRRTNFKPVANF